MYLLFPHEPEFEDIVESAALETLVSGIIRHIVAYLVLLK